MDDDALENTQPTLLLKEVAHAQQQSTRTLQRRLRKKGTTFISLRNDARHRKAKELLRDGDTTVATVAIALGYSDASSFCRAFKRWEGRTPGQFISGLTKDISPRGAQKG
jgi:AraC-like DNA-binding protein